jgi:hypothetical protein
MLMQLAGIEVSTGWMPSVRGKAAALLNGGGFVAHLRNLLRSAPALHADETPAPLRAHWPMCMWPAPAT